MNLRVLILIVVIVLLSLNVVIAGDTKKQITTTNTISYMLESFPKGILSTINSVIAYSTTASSLTTEFDSLARRDNLALQLGMWQAGRGGIGTKYWLSELTALRISANTGINIGLNSSGEFRQSNNALNQIGDTSTGTPRTVGNGYEIGLAPTVTLDVAISATIEKHLFSKKQVSPYIGFGMGISAYSDNITNFFNRYVGGTDTGAVRRWYYSFGGDYVHVPENTTQTGILNTQIPISRNVVSVSGHIIVGVEYWVLPSLSIAAEAIGVGNIRGTAYFLGNFQQSQTTTQSNGQTSMTKFTSTFSSQSPSITVSTGLNFSSSLTLSVYFGRNVLGDILEAFSSGSLFQW